MSAELHNGGGAGSANANAGSANAGAGSGNAGSAGSSQGSDWTTGFADDARGYVQNKGWKGPGDIVESYRNLEKLHGLPPEQIIKLPTKEDDVDGWNSVFSRLGKPKTAEDYGIQAPEQGGDPEFAKWASGTFHELGLTTKQAQALVNKWNDRAKAGQEAFMSSGKQKLEQETQTLQKEWGAAYEQNMNQAKAAAREFGIAPEVLDTIEKAAGFSTVMKAFSKIGGAIGESKFAGGKPANAVMTPSQAVAQIGELQKDKGFIQRLYSGDMAAKDQWSKLHQFAYQGDANF